MSHGDCIFKLSMFTGSLLRFAYVKYLSYARGPVRNKLSAHDIFGSTVFHKLPTFIFTFDLNTSRYLISHDLINITEDPNNTYLSKLAETKDMNKLFVTFLDEYISSKSFEVINTIKNLNFKLEMVNICMLMLIWNLNVELGKEKFHNA